jgi:hypothetical protein
MVSALPAPDEVSVLPLARMFDEGETLVARVVEQLRLFAATPRLRKTQTLTAAQASQALDVAFWAGLGFNEGRTTTTRLLFAEPELVPEPLRFETAVPYDPVRIVRLAPGVPEGGSIGVTPHTMTMWGLVPSDPGSSVNALSIFTTAPGVLHVRIGPLRPFAVVSNGRAVILADGALALPDELRRRLKKTITGDDIKKTQGAWRDCLLLAALARRMLQRGGGGALLLVPAATGDWTRWVEIAHRFATPDTALRDSVARELREDAHNDDARRIAASDLPEALKWQAIGSIPQHLTEEAAALRRVAPYASVDGAVVITRDLEVVGFGAKIVVPADIAPHVFISGPHIGPHVVERRPVEDTGGTRHQSAARFVGANREAVAIVVSHDAHVSLFFWDEELEGVSMVRNVEWWD